MCTQVLMLSMLTKPWFRGAEHQNARAANVVTERGVLGPTSRTCDGQPFWTFFWLMLLSWGFFWPPFCSGWNRTRFSARLRIWRNEFDEWSWSHF